MARRMGTDSAAPLLAVAGLVRSALPITGTGIQSMQSPSDISAPTAGLATSAVTRLKSMLKAA